ncbi:MAG TPA: hypothetical protein VGO47_00700 [Chlamydiales bacterium]|nr:hypothetical protein [Chlamydiales bacterium]
MISQPVAALSNSTYGVINHGIVKALLLQAVYTPFQSLAPLTSALASLEKGDATPMLSLAFPAITLPTCDARPSTILQVAEGGYPVFCGERFGPGRNIDNVIRELKHSKSISVLADRWVMAIGLPCTYVF